MIEIMANIAVNFNKLTNQADPTRVMKTTYRLFELTAINITQ